MKDHNKQKFKGIFVGFFHQLLQVDLIRYIIVRIRYFYFVTIRRRLKTYDLKSKNIAVNTVSHNLKGITDFAAVRPLALIKPLSVIESLSMDAKILTIGSRSEGEIFALIGYGFMPKNIRGLDLISYSPWIELGDMHNMNYEDNSFDVVFLGWVIAYSRSPEIVAKEVIRVIKPGGIIAIGVEYLGTEMLKHKEKTKYSAGAGRVTSNVDQFLKDYKNNIEHIYFSHSIHEDRIDMKGSVLSIFKVKK